MVSFSAFSSLLLLGLLLLASAAPNAKQRRQKSVIQLIGDGFGPASETFARSFVQARDGSPWDTQLALDSHLIGSIRTRSTDSLVTDSAASATAYSCGVKSVNAYIGVDNDKRPCGTILEGAKAKGYNTALVTTSRVTHATPASYSAHIDDRDEENEIASQQLGGYSLGRQVDLLWGGGRRHFLPNTSSTSSREDSRDLISEAKKNGWTVVLNRTEFENFHNGSTVSFPSLGLFTSSHMAYEIDRNHTAEPSLTEMAITALNALKKDGKPFFIMIEGARIDHAAHNNDPIGHVHDIIEYNNMFEAVKRWVDENDHNDDNEEPQYLMVSTADHECGGLALAYQRPEDEEGAYLWYPDVLLKGKRSTEFLAAEYLKFAANKTGDELKTRMADYVIRDNLGISDASDEEVQRALDLSKQNDTGLALTIWLASIVNWRAHLSWSTTGHSGVDVNLYLHTKKSRPALVKKMRGNHENTWIGTFTANYLGLDLASITQRLNNGSKIPAGAGSANKTTYLDHYHGGVKRVVPAISVAKRSNEIGYSHAENDAIWARRASTAHEASHLSLHRRSTNEL